MLNVDDGTFVFENRRDLEIGLLFIFNHFSKYGLEMYIGRGPKPYKIEYILFPQPELFKPSNHSSPTVDIDSSNITIPEKKENEKQKRQREEKSYEEAN